MDLQLEKELLCIEERGSNMSRVSQKPIMYKAKTMYNERVGDEGFKASNGWFEKFLNRNGLSLKTKATVVQKDLYS